MEYRSTSIRVLIAAWLVLSLFGCGRGRSTVDESVSTDTTETAVQPEVEFDGLNDTKQKTIWDLEHVTFELEHKFGKDFLNAIRAKDQEALARFFRNGFTGSVLPSESRRSVENAFWTEHRQAEGGQVSAAKREADKAALAGYFIESTVDFKTISHATFRVLAIDKLGEDNDLHKVKVWIAITGTNDEEKPLRFESTHNVLCEFATDEDIAAGEIVTQWNVIDESIRRTESIFMEEVTEAYGLKDLSLIDNWTSDVLPRRNYRFQMAVHDFNRDGYPDIAICSIDGPQYILQSVDGKSFRDVTQSVRIPAKIYGDVDLASWIDFNNDGYPDLLLGSTLYRNNDGKFFTDVTFESGLVVDKPREPMSAAVADYDRDGLLDLYIVYQHNTEYRGGGSWVNDEKSGAPNQLWRNLGNGRFADVTDFVGAGGGNRHSFAAVWLHANDDNDPDLYVANDFGENVLFENGAAKSKGFTDVSRDYGVGDFATSMGVAAADINGDTETEIYVANMYSKMGRRIIRQVCDDDYPTGIMQQIEGSCAGSRLYQRKQNSDHYEERSVSMGVNSVGWAYAPAFVDLDCDGFLDIYATTGYLSFDRKKPDG